MEMFSKFTVQRGNGSSPTRFTNRATPFNTTSRNTLARRLLEPTTVLLQPHENRPGEEIPESARQTWLPGPDLFRHRRRFLCSGKNSAQLRPRKNGGHH